MCALSICKYILLDVCLYITYTQLCIFVSFIFMYVSIYILFKFHDDESGVD